MLLMAAGAIRVRRGCVSLTARGRYYWVVMMRTLFSIAGTYREARMDEDAEEPSLAGSGPRCPASQIPSGCAGDLRELKPDWAEAGVRRHEGR